MFTLDDFWKIFEYLERFRYYKGLYQCDVNDTECIDKARKAASAAVPQLDSTVKSLAGSDASKTTSLFENTIDQPCFNTEDYARIRSFLIDWYSSLKTNVTLGRNSHDPFVLPPEYLNELVKSFGYAYPTDIPSVNSRVNFFLDLVNLYKIKGTPLALKRALDYNGLRNVDIAEYWLQKNESGQLVFRGVSVFPLIINLPFNDVRFRVASGDPHWFQTEQDIIKLLRQNVLCLPSKTPYFGIRPYFGYSEVQQMIAILVRRVADDYEVWKTTSTLNQDIKSDFLGMTISMLECYLSCVYIVNRCISYQDPALYTADRYLCYDGTSEVTSEITDKYKEMTDYSLWNRPNDPEAEILLRNIATQNFLELFTRENSRNFITGKIGPGSASDLLNSINPTLKATIDIYISSGKWFDVLLSLLLDLTQWIRVYINTEATDIISIVLGIEAIPSISRLINFFKPYRARLLTTQFLYVIDDPLFNFVRIYDRKFEFNIIETVYDYCTADSLGCSTCDGTAVLEPILYSREFYDCTSYFDIGIVWDRVVTGIGITNLKSTLNFHTDSTCDDGYFWHDDDVAACDFWGSWMDVPIDSTSTDIEMIVTGGFRDFDSCGIFDGTDGDDLVKVRLMPRVDVDFYGLPIAGYSDLSVQFYDISEGLLRRWLWNFGDGHTSIQQNPVHTFRSPDPDRAAPVADWYCEDSTTNLEVIFTSIAGGSPTIFMWDFGDGSPPSYEENPVHTFPKNDAYMVTLTVINDDGNSVSEDSILVGGS